LEGLSARRAGFALAGNPRLQAINMESMIAKKDQNLIPYCKNILTNCTWLSANFMCDFIKKKSLDSIRVVQKLFDFVVEVLRPFHLWLNFYFKKIDA
jgi:hypothetical protein